MSTKKAQVKFIEIFGVMIVFVFIVAIAIAFFGRIKILEEVKDQSEKADESTVKAANALSGLSEIQCSNAGSIDASCIDKYKYCALREFLSDDEEYREYYSSIIGTKKYIHMKVYDSSGSILTDICKINTKTTTPLYGLYDQSGVKYLGDEERKRPVLKPVYVYDPVTGAQNFALIEVYSLA